MKSLLLAIVAFVVSLAAGFSFVAYAQDVTPTPSPSPDVTATPTPSPTTTPEGAPQTGGGFLAR